MVFLCVGVVGDGVAVEYPAAGDLLSVKVGVDASDVLR
jgi:hypothetical protein